MNRTEAMTPTGQGRNTEISNSRLAVTIAIHKRNLKTKKTETGNQESENWKPETGNQKLRTENRELRTEN